MTQEKTYKLIINLKPQGRCEFTYTDELLAKEQHLQYKTQGIINGVLIDSIEYIPEAAKKTLRILKES